jgi:hypothetical protein
VEVLKTWGLVEGYKPGPWRGLWGASLFFFPFTFSHEMNSPSLPLASIKYTVLTQAQSNRTNHNELKSSNCDPKQTFPLSKSIISGICYSHGKVDNQEMVAS